MIQYSFNIVLFNWGRVSIRAFPIRSFEWPKYLDFLCLSDWLLSINDTTPPALKVNSLWPSDAICRQRSWSIFVHVVTYCLTASSHYLNHCWLIVSEVLWHSTDGYFREYAQDIHPWNEFRNNFTLDPHPQRSKEFHSDNGDYTNQSLNIEIENNHCDRIGQHDQRRYVRSQLLDWVVLIFRVAHLLCMIRKQEAI